MKKIILLLASSCVWMACKTDYDGRIQIVESMPAISNGKKVSIPVGTYPAALSFESQTKVTLTVTTPTTEYDLRMTIPTMSVAPADGTPVLWSSKVTGQPFDIVGQTKTKTHQTDVQTTEQSCMYQRPVEICWGGLHPGCGIDWVTYQGWQQVEYYDVITDRTVTAEVREPGTAHLYADLSGTNSDSDRHYVSEGPCF